MRSHSLRAGVSPRCWRGQRSVTDHGRRFMGVSFFLADKDQPSQTIRVDFRGTVPDTFKPGAEVIVEGGVNPASGAFAATTLMTKCPSKYQKENRG